MKRFQHELQTCARAVEQRLEEVLSLSVTEGEILRPQRLVEAMRYGVLNGGKRLRPFLVMQSGALFGVADDNLLQVAAALECVHCYSLIHDDLPAMDDDDMRRGKPTAHRAFDEASAILAGDALLTLAFEMLADGRAHEDASIRLALISNMAKAAGVGGMAGGQMLDLHPPKSNPGPDDVSRMQTMKTGALITYACQAGAICGQASRQDVSALVEYGRFVGQAFQLADDILDVTSTAGKLGKGVGKDGGRGKITQVSSLGADGAREMADELVVQACEKLARFGSRADMLKAAARFIVSRDR